MTPKVLDITAFLGTPLTDSSIDVSMLSQTRETNVKTLFDKKALEILQTKDKNRNWQQKHIYRLLKYFLSYKTLLDNIVGKDDG